MYLQHVDDPSHVPRTQPEDSLHPLARQSQALLPADLFDTGLGMLECNLFELEAGASVLKGRDDLGDVVRDEAETGIGMILLNDCIRRVLLRRSANWAVLVIMSASSKMISFRLRLRLLILARTTLTGPVCLKTS